MPVAGSFQLMKSMNRSLILNTIRLDGPISRADIAKKTKLTPPTVTNIVAELIEEKLVRESKMGESRGGRKPILLTIDAKNSFVIGLDVGGYRVRAVLTDLNGEVEGQTTVELSSDLTEETLIDQLIKITVTLFEQCKMQKDKVIGIGIGMHGIVDHQSGMAVFAPNFQLTNIDLKTPFESTFDVPVFVENDARALALGETWFGNGQGIDHVICVNVGVGIGAGIVLNKRLFHGVHGIAGEIGHTTVDIHGKKCTCGNYGCLQTVAGGNMLKERAIHDIASGRKTMLLEKVEGDMDRISGEIIHQCALAGDPLSIEILEEAGKYLGIGITNIINFINPDRIIVGGGVSKAGDFVLEPLRKMVKERALTAKARETEVVTAELGEWGTAIGAVTLVLEDLFAPIYQNRDRKSVV